MTEETLRKAYKEAERILDEKPDIPEEEFKKFLHSLGIYTDVDFESMLRLRVTDCKKECRQMNLELSIHRARYDQLLAERRDRKKGR